MIILKCLACKEHIPFAKANRIKTTPLAREGYFFDLCLSKNSDFYLFGLVGGIVFFVLFHDVLNYSLSTLPIFIFHLDNTVIFLSLSETILSGNSIILTFDMSVFQKIL